LLVEFIAKNCLNIGRVILNFPNMVLFEASAAVAEEEETAAGVASVLKEVRCVPRMDPLRARAADMLVFLVGAAAASAGTEVSSYSTDGITSSNSVSVVMLLSAVPYRLIPRVASRSTPPVLHVKPSLLPLLV
jgi:hypothetical protein